MNIYIDVGNTNIKVLFENDSESIFKSIPTKGKYTIDSLFKEMPDYKGKIDGVWISSVVPSITTLFIGLSKKYWKISPIKIAYPFKSSIKIKADEPKVMGSDLISLAAYGIHKYPEAIIVNLGTATTITHVKDRTLMGTIIIPGLSVSLNSLIKNAAKIGEIDLYVPNNKSVGNNTEEAISIGVVKGTAFMIEGLVNNINPDCPVILSGGNSKVVAKFLPKYELIEEATIQGIKLLANRG